MISRFLTLFRRGENHPEREALLREVDDLFGVQMEVVVHPSPHQQPVVLAPNLQTLIEKYLKF